MTTPIQFCFKLRCFLQVPGAVLFKVFSLVAVRREDKERLLKGKQVLVSLLMVSLSVFEYINGW